MIAALLSVALACAGPASILGATRPGATRVEARVQATPRATLESAGESSVVRIGDPVTWTIEVEGDAASSGPAKLLDDSLLRAGGDLGVGWAIIDGPSPLRAGASDLHLRWTLLPLEGGTVRTPAVSVQLADGSELLVPEATLEVLPALAPEEDEPRPLPGFRDVADRSVGDPRVALLVVLLLIAAPIVLYVIAVRRGSRAQGGASAREPSPEEQLAELDAAAEPAVIMARLGPLARRVVDARDGVSRASLTDQEWADSVTAQHAGSPLASAASRVGRAVVDSSATRFGGLAPTAYAAREALDGVRASLSGWAAGDGGATDASSVLHRRAEAEVKP